MISWTERQDGESCEKMLSLHFLVDVIFSPIDLVRYIGKHPGSPQMLFERHKIDSTWPETGASFDMHGRLSTR